MSERIKFNLAYDPSPSDKGMTVANTIIAVLRSVPHGEGELADLMVNAGIIRHIERRLKGNNTTVSLLSSELIHIRDRLRETRYDVYIPAYLETWERVFNAVDSPAKVPEAGE